MGTFARTSRRRCVRATDFYFCTNEGLDRVLKGNRAGVSQTRLFKTHAFHKGLCLALFPAPALFWLGIDHRNPYGLLALWRENLSTFAPEKTFFARSSLN